MQSSFALREKLMQLLAADTATLAQAADNNLVALIMAPFTPAEGLAIGDLTFADFDGSTPIEVELGTQPEGIAPGTTDSIITISPPAGGWRWETTGLTNLPQTIYGFALVNNGSTVLFGSQAFSTPIDLNAINQVIQLDSVTFTLAANTLQ
jgi:hypothetical protein